MPRFVGRQIIVEAYQFHGGTALFPEDFRRAILRHLPGGITEVATGEGPRTMKYGDWLLRGPDGAFLVREAGAFDAWFEMQVQTPLIPFFEMQTPTLPAQPKAAGKLKEKVNG